MSTSPPALVASAAGSGPGICVIKDTGREVTRKVVQCDLLVILSPITFGGYSSEVKKALDRSLGIMLPFFTRINGKTHHKARYRRYPRLIVIGTQSSPDEELGSIFRSLVGRNVVNAHSPGHAVGVVQEGQGVESVRPEIVALMQKAGVVD